MNICLWLCGTSSAPASFHRAERLDEWSRWCGSRSRRRRLLFRRRSCSRTASCRASWRRPSQRASFARGRIRQLREVRVLPRRDRTRGGTRSSCSRAGLPLGESHMVMEMLSGVTSARRHIVRRQLRRAVERARLSRRDVAWTRKHALFARAGRRRRTTRTVRVYARPRNPMKPNKKSTTITITMISQMLRTHLLQSPQDSSVLPSGSRRETAERAARRNSW